MPNFPSLPSLRKMLGLFPLVLALAACGGGGGSLTAAGGSGGSSNTLAITVDSGPTSLTNATSPQYAANLLFATVTICTHGSSTACQTIDHLQVDTGSYGLVVMNGALTGAATPAPLSVAGGPLRECIQYADGYVWGSIATVDVKIAGRTIASMPINVAGDPAAGSAPASCSSGAGSSESTVAAFGANGALGIGYFLQDCGQDCVTTAYQGGYYACPVSGCVPTTVPLGQQLQNPIGALAADNNGAVIVLPAVSAAGQAIVNGTLYFGIGTQANNGIGSASFYTVNGSTQTVAAPATLVTTYGGASLSGSVIDSGSNAYYFNDTTIPACTDYTYFFCPASTLTLNATIQGENGANAAVTFPVENADALLNTQTVLAAFPGLAGPTGGVPGVITGFDWGLPFFFGRSVYVLFEGATAGTVAGPAVGF
jgi:hypothetical protein